MNREFLDLYNRELRVLYEGAKEFAEEYAGVADRLGGLTRDRMDPMITGLLEGAAFLAARVQLKLKHEFPEFTNNLLEQLVPHYLAPTPSAMLVKITPPFGEPALRQGRTIARGSYLDAVYSERERNVSCRFRLNAPVTLWPFEVAAAQYYMTPGPIQALGVPVEADVISGLRITLTHRTAQRVEDEISDAEAAKRPDTLIAGVGTKELTVYLLGSEADADGLYEQIFSDCRGVYIRYLDSFGDP